MLIFERYFVLFLRNSSFDKTLKFSFEKIIEQFVKKTVNHYQ